MHGIEGGLVMSKNKERKNIWSQLDELPSQEVLKLVQVTVAVLEDKYESTEKLSKAPPKLLKNVLRTSLEQKGLKIDNAQTSVLIKENETSLALSRKLLSEIACYPELAKEVEEEYQKREKMMSWELVGWLLAGALLVLAIKVKEIKTKKGGVKFFELSDKAVAAVGKLLGTGKG